MKKIKVISPSLFKDPVNSMVGWNVKEFFNGYFNIIKPTLVQTLLKTFKELCKYIISAFVAYVVTKNPLWTVILTPIEKAILDMLDYALKEKTA